MYLTISINGNALFFRSLRQYYYKVEFIINVITAYNETIVFKHTIVVHEYFRKYLKDQMSNNGNYCLV